MKRQRLCFAGTMLATALIVTAAYADPTNDNDQAGNRDKRSEASRSTSSEAVRSQTFLGVAVATLDDSLRSHLKSQISDGSGLVVEEIADGSPAAKAGLRQHDILVSFDDQRLYSPEQLVRMVENDKPGREVKLHIIRGGKAEDIEATLGSHQRSSGMDARCAYSWPMANQQRQRQSRHENQQDERDNQWQSFDALTLSRVDGGHFKAEISYRDDKGRVDSHKFQGTRDEIREKIEGQKDMPSAERDRLLRALNIAAAPGEVDFQEFHLSNERN